MELSVTGMTCESCANALRRSIAGAAPGAAVEVDLAAGRVRVAGSEDRQAIVAAIEKAGFAVAE